MRQRVFDGKEHRLEVDGHHLVPFTLGGLVKSFDLDDPGIIDEHIEPAKMRNRSPDRIPDLGFAADVTSRRQGLETLTFQFRRNWPAELERLSDYSHPGSLTREQVRR